MSMDNYVGVHERIIQFRKDYPQGFITTEATSVTYGEISAIRFKAQVFRNPEEASLYGTSGVAAATGHSESILEEDKVLEKAETVAIGRALAILGYSAENGVASKEEMDNYQSQKSERAAAYSGTEKVRQERPNYEVSEEDDGDDTSAPKNSNSRLEALQRLQNKQRNRSSFKRQ